MYQQQEKMKASPQAGALGEDTDNKDSKAVNDLTPDELLYPIYTAMLDYDSGSPSELSFKRGDQMYIKSMGEEEMWQAKLTVGTGQEGDIPKSYVSALEDEM